MTGGDDLSDELKKKIAKSVEDHVVTYFESLRKKGTKGSVSDLANIPMDSIIPMAFVYYVTQASSDVNFADPFVEFGSSIQHFKLMTDK